MPIGDLKQVVYAHDNSITAWAAFKTIIRWVSHDKGGRLDQLQSLIDQVPLEKLSEEQLLEALGYDLVGSSDICRAALEKALDTVRAVQNDPKTM